MPQLVDCSEARHAGAILGSDQESAKQKTIALKKAGVKTADSIAELIELM